MFFVIAINALAIYAADYFIAGFQIEENLREIIIAAATLSFINFTFRPLLKLIFSPLIIITLGLFSLIINAFTLYLLDYFLKTVTIIGLDSLILATLLIGIINFLCQRLLLRR
ncbi:MAG: phage holin family protein [Candidatus Liptonbacteria bacterium]|nr:phage holin family protein [Candidatus Liptonbacteria bacterium]